MRYLPRIATAFALSATLAACARDHGPTDPHGVPTVTEGDTASRVLQIVVAPEAIEIAVHETYRLAYGLVTSGNATGGVVWYATGPGIAVEHTGYVTGVHPTTASVCVQSVYDASQRACATVRVRN